MSARFNFLCRPALSRGWGAIAIRAPAIVLPEP
jgi:hypothetical protein